MDMIRSVLRRRVSLVFLLILALSACGRSVGSTPGIAPKLNTLHAAPGHATLQITGAMTATANDLSVACSRRQGDTPTFIVSAQGPAGGKQIFLSLTASPYHGPGLYQPTTPPSPGPLRGEFQPDPSPAGPAVQGPLGFLNFDPKYEPGNAWESPPNDVLSALSIDRAGQSGRFEADMYGANSRVRAAQIHLSGSFDCSGPAGVAASPCAREASGSANYRGSSDPQTVLLTNGDAGRTMSIKLGQTLRLDLDPSARCWQWGDVFWEPRDGVLQALNGEATVPPKKVVPPGYDLPGAGVPTSDGAMHSEFRAVGTGSVKLHSAEAPLLDCPANAICDTITRNFEVTVRVVE